MHSLAANPSTLEVLFEKQKLHVSVRRKEPIKNRVEQLEKLRAWIHNNRSAIHQAMYADFQKPALEVDGVELFHVLNEIKLAIAELHHWATPKKVDAPITMLGTKSFIHYEPKGCCLIISPWNYPFSLAIGPLVSCLAAGNTAILKPSEHTPNVSALLERMVDQLFDERCVKVLTGGIAVAESLLKLPFDHIFFTGSPAIGKTIMKAAADHLSSITLELGGKSPCLVTKGALINEAAERIAVAKFINNGQTCVAPDYILIDETLVDKFIPALIKQVKKLFLTRGDTFETSTNYGRIVNDGHFDRLTSLIQDAQQLGAKVEFEGKSNKAARFIHPLVLTNISPKSRLFHEEIFGPILPVITFKQLNEAISIINAKPKPLSLYIFSTNNAEQRKILEETSSGGVCINDCAIHFLHHNLPFGGVNNSGMGRSHGYSGFLAFSNEKAILKQKHGFTSVKSFYPPYTTMSKKIMDWFLKLF